MTDYERISKVIQHLEGHVQDQPSLTALADLTGLSEAHFHRLFRRWAGVTPKDFLQCLSVEFAKTRLQQSRSILDAAYETGFSAPSRLHDLMVTLEAATPGEIKSGGAGKTLHYGWAETPFGTCLFGWNERGVCCIAFGDDRSPLESAWPNATLQEDAPGAEELAGTIFSNEEANLKALVRGTPFQVKVWRALLQIPFGETRSYGQIATEIGHPGAVRAVGSACGENLVAFLIPCHRVIRQTAIVQGYRWGPERKRAMLAWEACRRREPMPGG